MATYDVRIVVTCDVPEEYAELKAHLLRHGVTPQQPAPYLSVVFNDSRRIATMNKRETGVLGAQWS